MTQFTQGVDVLPKTWPKTPHDNLPVPGNRKLGAVPTAELVSLLIGLGVAGASHEIGRSANAAAYGAHIERLRTEGADNAVKAWLEGLAK